MATRQRYDVRINPVNTQPVSAPVDTYVRPAESDAQKLAAALAEVQPAVGRFNQTLSAEYIKNQKERGEQAARIHSEQALKAGDMTRMGTLPMQENPYFMSAYEEEWGRVAAGMWQSDFKAAAAADQNLHDSTNLADFDKAVGAHVADWMQKNNVDRSAEFERGFGHMKDAYVANERLNFAEGIEKKLDLRSDEALFALTKRAVTDNWGHQGITSDQIASDIDTIVQFQVKRGRPEQKARRAATAAIRAAALEADEPSTGLLMLNLLQKVPGQEGKGKLSDQSYGSEAYSETRKDLILKAQQNAEKQRRDTAYAKQQSIDLINNDAFQALKKDPSIRLDSWLKDNHPEADSDVLRDLKGLQGEWQDLSFTTNQFVYRRIFDRIWDEQSNESPVSVSEIISRSRNFQLRPEDSEKLISMLSQRDEIKKRAGKDPLDEKVKDYFRVANEYAEKAFANPVSGIAAGEKAERVRNTKALLLARWEDLRPTAAKMSENDLNDWFVKQTNKIVAGQMGSFKWELDPPSQPDIMGTGKGTSSKAEPKKSEKPELPKELVLAPEDFDTLLSGNYQAVQEALSKRGIIIPADQWKDFVHAQVDLYKKQVGAEQP